jgi:hypothetical protein
MAREVLGWTAKRDLADITSSAWNWMQKNEVDSPAVRARRASIHPMLR